MSSLSQAHPLGYLPSPQCAFQGHAAHALERSRRLDPTTHGVPVYPKVVTTFLHNASRRTRRAMHASGDSPWHSSAKHHILEACFFRMTPFRSMLLTLQSGLQSLTPRAQSVPAYAQVLRHSSIALSRRTRISWWTDGPQTVSASHTAISCV